MPGGGGMPSNKATVQMRIKKIEGYITLGMTTREIVRRCMEDDRICERQVRRYLERIAAEWEAQSRAELPVVRDRLRQSFRKLYQQALGSKDREGRSTPNLMAAIAALRELCRIDGAYAPTEANVSLSGNVETRVTGMTTGDRRDRLKELLDKYGYVSKAEANEANGKTNGHNGTN